MIDACIRTHAFPTTQSAESNALYTLTDMKRVRRCKLLYAPVDPATVNPPTPNHWKNPTATRKPLPQINSIVQIKWLTNSFKGKHDTTKDGVPSNPVLSQPGKRSRSAYLCYSKKRLQEIQRELKKKHLESTFTTVSEMIREEWENMDTQARAPFEKEMIEYTKRTFNILH